MTTFRIPRSAYDSMVREAERDYPDETCGFLFSVGVGLDVVPMANIQNRLHAEDPERHSRDARTAYCFEPREMQRVLDEREQTGHALRGIYHSHPDHDSYFSETDSAAASPFGEPSYPGAVYPVFSVRGGAVVDLKVFDWSETEERYVEVPFEIV